MTDRTPHDSAEEQGGFHELVPVPRQPGYFYCAHGCHRTGLLTMQHAVVNQPAVVIDMTLGPQHEADREAKMAKQRGEPRRRHTPLQRGIR